MVEEDLGGVPGSRGRGEADARGGEAVACSGEVPPGGIRPLHAGAVSCGVVGVGGNGEGGEAEWQRAAASWSKPRVA